VTPGDVEESAVVRSRGLAGCLRGTGPLRGRGARARTGTRRRVWALGGPAHKCCFDMLIYL